jgi:hypothetical protein
MTAFGLKWHINGFFCTLKPSWSHFIYMNSNSGVHRIKKRVNKIWQQMHVEIKKLMYKAIPGKNTGRLKDHQLSK